MQSPKLPMRPILSAATVWDSALSGAGSPCSRALAGAANIPMIPAVVKAVAILRDMLVLLSSRNGEFNGGGDGLFKGALAQEFPPDGGEYEE